MFFLFLTNLFFNLNLVPGTDTSALRSMNKAHRAAMEALLFETAISVWEQYRFCVDNGQNIIYQFRLYSKRFRNVFFVFRHYTFHFVTGCPRYSDEARPRQH